MTKLQIFKKIEGASRQKILKYAFKVGLSPGMVYCYPEFKLHYFKNPKVFSIRVKRKKYLSLYFCEKFGDGVLLLFEAFFFSDNFL